MESRPAHHLRDKSSLLGLENEPLRSGAPSIPAIPLNCFSLPSSFLSPWSPPLSSRPLFQAFLTPWALPGLLVIPEQFATSSVSNGMRTWPCDPYRCTSVVSTLRGELFKGRSHVFTISISLARGQAPSLIQQVFTAWLLCVPGVVWHSSCSPGAHSPMQGTQPRESAGHMFVRCERCVCIMTA